MGVTELDDAILVPFILGDKKLDEPNSLGRSVVDSGGYPKRRNT